MSTPSGEPGRRELTAEDVARAADRVTIKKAIELTTRDGRPMLAWLLRRHLSRL